MKNKYKHVKSEKFMDKYIIKGIKGIKGLFSKNSDSEEKKEKHIPMHLNSEKKKKHIPQHLNVKESKTKGIKTLFFKSAKNKAEDSKPKRYVGSKIMEKKKGLFSKNSKPKKENKLVQSNSNKKEKYEPKHLNSEESNPRGIKTLFLKKSKNKDKGSSPKRYIGCGMMKKIKAFALAAAVGLSSSVYATTAEFEVEPINDSNNTLIEELPDAQNESLEHTEITVHEGNKIHKISLNTTVEKNNNLNLKETLKKVDMSKPHSVAREDDAILHSKSSGDILDTESVAEYSDISVVESANELGEGAGLGEESINSDSEINPLAMAEFRISEDDMLTEGEILYAFTKLMKEWNGPEKEIENVKEMMDALLRVQKDFGVSALAILAIAHWESHCGLDYEQYNQIRLVNNEAWKTPDGQYVQIGVTGYSKAEHYCLFDTVDNAIYDVGNYMTNSWALEGAKTMWDLEYGKDKDKDLHIFNGASREGAYMYDKLKQYAKEYRTLYGIKVGEDSAEVTIYDISEAVEGLKTEDIYQTAEEVVSRSQNKNLEEKKEVYERE